jgi:hypothetical protein
VNVVQVWRSARLAGGKWLVFLGKATSVEQLFSDVDIPFDSEFLVAQTSSALSNGSSAMSLTEVYKVQSTSPLHKNLVANWSSESGLSWTTAPLHQRRDLQGVIMRCVFLPEVRLPLRSVCILVSKRFKCIDIACVYSDIFMNDQFFPPNSLHI